MKIRDKFWVWGHPKNSLYGNFGIKTPSNLSPAGGMEYLGAKNIFYVPMNLKVNESEFYEGIQKALRIGIAVEDFSERNKRLEHIISLSQQYKNIHYTVFDDFFNEENKRGNYLNYSHEELGRIKNYLKKSGLETFLVVYTKQFGNKEILKEYIRDFDCVSMWFWSESEVSDYENKIKEFLSLTEDKKRMIGLYLYNFGEEKSADEKTVLYELEKLGEMLRQKLIEGVILHTNAVADADCKAADVARDWLEKYGDDILL